MIDRNTDRLKELVHKYAQAWSLQEGFKKWTDNSNIFCNTLVDFHKRTKDLPRRMSFSLAALIVYYRGVFNGSRYLLEDDGAITAFFQSAWSGFNGSRQACNTLAAKILGNYAFRQMDLTGR